MDLFILLFVFFVIPAILLILLLTWGLIRMGKVNLALRARKYLLRALGAGVIIILTLDWTDRNHFRSFPLNDHVELKLHIEEIDSFLDQPTDFTLRIIGPEGKRGQFEFSSGEGAQLAFYASEQEEIIWIKGIEYNEGYEWFLDYEGNEISKSEMDLLPEGPEFELFAELDYKLIITEK